MTLSRRTWLLTACGGVLSRAFLSAQRAGYSQQGFHRTGTSVDERSGHCLFDHVKRIGLKPSRETFALSRVDPGDCRAIDG